ncbi:porin family protein [Polaribacter sp. 20A6]|uniref:porin family protein n=1 Tax=Polaribacter sp. 20A6 TaxID=2687289 RepID=UPI0013FD5C2E|nr:porin family protein [Polaribacter sp. 20A6]
MKKGVAILFILLMTSSSNFGQSSMKYFVKGGLNLSNTNFKVIERGVSSSREFDNRKSFYVAAGINFPLTEVKDNILLQVQLVYSEQGWVYNYTEPGDFTAHEINQINLPIYLKTRVLHNFYLNIGTYLGYVVHSKEKTSDNPNRFEIEGYKNFDSGLLAGFEYHFNFGLFLETKYMFGLSDISKVAYPTSFIEHSYKNRVLQIGLGYTF